MVSERFPAATASHSASNADPAADEQLNGIGPRRNNLEVRAQSYSLANAARFATALIHPSDINAHKGHRRILRLSRHSLTPPLVQISRASWRRKAGAVSAHDELHRTCARPSAVRSAVAPSISSISLLEASTEQHRHYDHPVNQRRDRRAARRLRERNQRWVGLG
jgi:hypothetical protein